MNTSGINAENVGCFDDGKEVSSLGPPEPSYDLDTRPCVVTNEEAAAEAFCQNDLDPGLQGDYSQSCCVCLRGTDTALAFQGEVEWLIAGLMSLGIPEQEAGAMVSRHFGCPDGEVPCGCLTLPVRVCSECVSRANPSFPAPAVVMRDAQFPVIGQP
jgi:hypothetical protein